MNAEIDNEKYRMMWKRIMILERENAFSDTPKSIIVKQIKDIIDEEMKKCY